MAQLQLLVLEDLIGLVLGQSQQQILSAARTGSELRLRGGGGEDLNLRPSSLL
jgi:hypothetical protein